MPDTDRFDYIVVGGGTAGCVVAQRLSVIPGAKVLLLEAGGHRQPLRSHIPLTFHSLKNDPRTSWRYVTEPEPGADGRRFPRPHGKGLGGSSAINGMIAVRGHTSDYDGWAFSGLPGWSYRDLRDCFARAEGALGLAGRARGESSYADPFFDALVDSARLAGRAFIDVSTADREGIGVPDFTIASGTRVSTATAYLSKAGGGLTITTNALVSRLLLAGQRVIGVEAVLDGSPHRLLADCEVILCAGAYNSPQILMLSGIGDERELRKAGIEPVHHLPGVGKNLHGHCCAPLRFRARDRIGFHRELRIDRLAWAAVRWLVSRSGPMAQVPLTALGYIRSHDGLEAPDIQVMYSSGRFDDRPWCPGIYPGIGYFMTASLSLCRPRSRGTVSLRSKSPLDPPRIHLNLFSDADDLARLRNALKKEREFFSSPPLAALTGDEELPGISYRTDEEIELRVRQTATTAQHPTSTCAMGNSPAAVTDHELRVHGLQGIRVADASVMPAVVSSNTYLTTVMIGEKAADLIAGQSHSQEYV